MSVPRALRYQFQPKHRKLKGILGPGSGPQGRIMRLRQLVTAMVRFERLELSYGNADETRGYVERLIHDAVKYGDRHKATMDMADFWLLEKDLVHKLFKVLVPRYENYSTAFTRVYRLPAELPGGRLSCALLELKGNPWPSVITKQRDLKNTLPNVLLEEAAKESKVVPPRDTVINEQISETVENLSEQLESLEVKDKNTEGTPV